MKVTINISGKLKKTEMRLGPGEVAEIEVGLNGEYRIKTRTIEPKYMCPSFGVLPVGMTIETFSELSEEERGYVIESTAENENKWRPNPFAP